MSVFNDGPVILDTPERMLEVWREVSTDASVWRGAMDNWDINGVTVWRLQLNNDRLDEPAGKVVAMLGDYLALVYGRILKLSEAEL